MNSDRRTLQQPPWAQAFIFVLAIILLILLASPSYGQNGNNFSGTGGGFTPPVVATQSVNGADLLKCIRATDTAETGNCFKIVNAANNTTLLTLDVDGNIFANSLLLPNNTSISWKDSGGTVRNAFTVGADNVLTISNFNADINIGPQNNNKILLSNNNQATVLMKQYDVGNQFNGVNIGSGFSAAPTRELTLKNAVANAAAHTQFAIIAAQGDSATVDRVIEACSNSDSTCTAPVYSMTANGALDNYGGTPNAGVGVVPVKGVISSTGKTAAITTATLCTSTNCPAGQYEADFYLASTVTCATPGPAVVAASITYTDDAGTKTAQAIPLDVNGGVSLGANMGLGNTTNSAVGHTTFWVASGTTQYATTYTGCTSGTGTYSLRIAVRRLL